MLKTNIEHGYLNIKHKSIIWFSNSTAGIGFTPKRIENKDSRSSCGGSVVMNPTSIQEDMGLILGLTQWVKDLALPWLWCKVSTAVPIRPLAWELPYFAGAALKRQRKREKKTGTQTDICTPMFMAAMFGYSQ